MAKGLLTEHNSKSIAAVYSCHFGCGDLAAEKFGLREDRVLDFV
jgi:hypothetical protein